MDNPLHQFLFFSSSNPSTSSSDPAARSRVDHARKRRSELAPVGFSLSLDRSNRDVVPIPRQRKISRKPDDPNAPKITRPCSECGKKFWSCKALFGHMRCHPERQWRGMNPPVHLHPQQAEIFDSVSGKAARAGPALSEEDHEVASYLLMLANGRAAGETTSSVADPAEASPSPGTVYPDSSCHFLGQFECSSCKKVFRSHQALGGHRASHKNVKGCFANAMMSSISTDCREYITVSDYNRKKSEFREHDHSGVSLPTRLVIDSLTAVKEICGVDLSLRLGI